MVSSFQTALKENHWTGRVEQQVSGAEGGVSPHSYHSLAKFLGVQCPGSTLNLYLFYGNFKHDHNEIVPKKEVEKPDTRILNYSLFYPVILFGSKYLPLGKSLMMHYVRIIGRRVSVHRF